MPTPLRSQPEACPHFPHLREVCAILATGLVRLCCHSADEVAGDPAGGGGPGENSLHYLSKQSASAAPNPRGTA
jgi:hypothetical protein